MSRKNKLIIISAIVIILIIFIAFNTAKNNKNKVNNTDSEKMTSAEMKYDEETRLYYVQDKETGEIIAAGEDEIALKIYVDNPDYNPSPFNYREPIDLKVYREELDITQAGLNQEN